VPGPQPDQQLAWHARGSRRSTFALIPEPCVVHTTSSPSSTNQIGVTCGLPSALVTPSFPVRVPVITNARHS
jgi:hypothetical protein